MILLNLRNGLRTSLQDRRPDAPRRRGVPAVALMGLCLIVAGVAFPSLVSAREYGEEPDLEYARRGIYLSLGVLGATYTAAEGELEDALDGLGFSSNVQFDESVGVELVAGYRALHHLGLEFEVEVLTPSDVSFSPFGNVADVQTVSFTLNAKVYPFLGRFQPYALVGVGIMETKIEVPGTDGTFSGAAFRLGGGVEYYLTPSWVLDVGAEYLLPGSGEVEHLDNVSYGGGLTYRFWVEAI